MKIATSCEPILESNVREFLKQHQGEVALQTACELVRACFPELKAIQVDLLEDPDEDNHTWVILNVLMPATHPPDLLKAQETNYYQQIAQQSSLPYHPFSFSLKVDSI
jgi:hypothetical protein